MGDGEVLVVPGEELPRVMTNTRTRFRLQEVRPAAVAPVREKPQAPPEAALSLQNPHWGEPAEEIEHGDELEMCAEGKGLDGRKVRFLVQHLERGEWVHYRDVDGEVRAGMARAKLVFHHPESDSEEGTEVDEERTHFRFSVSLI
jgi:hypothetical protein